jgi:8-oxo-dGTP pyrophosphatase MutT (NUDIX family)
MDSNYKIYYNNSVLLISSGTPQSNKNFGTVLSAASDVDDFLKAPDILFDGVSNGNILLITPEPDKRLNMLRAQLKVIVAGGGIVFNENDELLMMFRRGKWDLPKGKIDIGEDIMTGAEREVLEETGVKIKTITEPPVITYHAYVLKGKRSLKQTSWYQMLAQPGQQKPVPQVEEDIEEVKWVKGQDLKNYQSGAYPLVWDLIAPYAL